MTNDVLNFETLDAAPAVRDPAAASFLTLTLLGHPDSARVGERAQLAVLDAARSRVALSRTEPLFGPPRSTGTARAAPLTCPFVSRKPILLEGLGNGVVRIDIADSGKRVLADGALVTEPLVLDAARLEGGVVLQVGTHVVLLVHREHARAPIDGGEADTFGMVGDSDALERVRLEIARAAAVTASVLVRGETGSGKELVAAALHRVSSRRDGPFVAVNMAAVPPTLAASELFGHARGAFSGAERANDGYFARADGGTLFLDEVADSPPDVQAALLRVLETGEIQAVGARAGQRVDVRVVAATDGDLEGLVASDRFRAPLLYRLATTEVRVPPLRERRSDIGRLIVHFLRAGLAALGKEALLAPAVTEETPWLPAGVVARLAAYSWPGNVRQLKSVCQHLVAMSALRVIPADDPLFDRLMPPIRTPAPTPSPTPSPSPSPSPTPTPTPTPALPPRDPLREAKAMSPDEIYQVMLAVDFGLGAAADWLGVSRPTMNDLIDRHPRLRRAQRIDAPEIVRANEEARASGTPAWRLLEVSERGLQRRMKELGLE